MVFLASKTSMETSSIFAGPPSGSADLKTDEYSAPEDGGVVDQLNEYCYKTTQELAFLRNGLEVLLQRTEQLSVLVTAILQNQQQQGIAAENTVGYDWGIGDNTSIEDATAIVDALNWIVRQIPKGSNSIHPAQLGLNWNSEFPNVLPIWQTKKKPYGIKIGIKRFVKEYGNGILSVEVTTNHGKARILFNP